MVVHKTYTCLKSHWLRSGTKHSRAAQHWQPGQLLDSSGQDNLLTNTHRHIWKAKGGKKDLEA